MPGPKPLHRHKPLHRLRAILREEEWQFAPHERPAMPGSPGSPDHPGRRRLGYGATSVLIGLTGGLGNALVTVNTGLLGGALGLTPTEIAWLPTAVVMAGASVNLLLIKFRQQFGLRPFALIFVSLYALVTFLHLFAHQFWSAVAVRAASGMAGAALSSLALYYMMQALPARWRLKAIVLGIGVPQCATPLARLFSPELLAASQWRTLYLFEFGLALFSLAAILALRLPPTERQPAFERTDFLTFALYTGGVALVAAVLGQGRLLWWTQSAWLGWALAAAIPLLVTAFAIEHRRERPLLNTRWLGSADILRFTVVTIMARIALSEQGSAVNMLAVLGQGNDQLIGLYALVLAASVAGVALSAATIDPDRLTHPVMLSVALVAGAAWADSHATSLSRAQQFYATQALIGFAGTFFLGPSLLFGMTRALKEGTGHVISFIALFGIINSIGSLAGTAALGSFQQARERVHSAAITQGIDGTDPLVQQRIAAGGTSVARVVGDPALARAEGSALLAQAATREANVRAYNDTFRLVAWLGLAVTAYLGFLLARRSWRARRAAA